MMIHIANPIYDSVFKYLVEDERIAKTLLSALLKKEVVDVQVRRHEYANGAREKVSLFRIDFGAQVRESDGSSHLVLIELQKTWLETETLRFRQYLGTQYANPENIPGENNPGGYAIPMITVYLLGHRLGDIEEPVLYVSRRSFNYYGDEVTKGLPDPFVESLTHDSIIVQIPLLKGQVNNRLEKVLSVFDQTMKDRYNNQVLSVDENRYEGDAEMQYILRRLLAAASDSKVRQSMNVEDEFLAAIENRDTAIMMRDKLIIEKDNVIAEKDNVIAEKDNAIAEKDNVIAEKDSAIAEKDSAIAEKDNTIAEKDNQLTKKDEMLRSMIRTMLESGMNRDGIAKAVGLSVDEIDKLLK